MWWMLNEFKYTQNVQPQGPINSTSCAFVFHTHQLQIVITMKTASSLAFSFLFLAFITKPLLVASEQPLVDINGDKVRTGTTYRIVSAIRGGGGGGLTLADGRNGLCPLDVVQLGSDLMWGLPFLFSPVNNTVEEENDVPESTDLNIIFATPQIMICGEPKVWKVDNYDQSTGQWFITTNGAVGNPGAQTLESWFKFEKVNGNTYKIKYCPSVCETCVSLCSDVGIYFGNGGRRLALSKTSPFLVNIYKAEDASNGKIVSVI
ncbi:hypothetical protein EZV62_019230 [Acer yangbiense]|uniref:Uncharacterized protein n=1 Tax=Acer yangbiense TaxID=1000413 RepID=A0A5C7HAK5_9ROSI|nr:hypothetical protein EZV62_019230 [Acer yangbiense]